MKSLIKIFSIRSETDVGLSSRSNFPERHSSSELEFIKTILPEIDHLRGKIWEGEFETLKGVLNRKADAFLKQKADIGCCKLFRARIQTRERHCSPRGWSKVHDNAQIGGLPCRNRKAARYDMIESSKSSWGCGVVITKKKGGQLRFCCNFCYSSSVIITDAYPTPRIDKRISKFGGAKFFATLDLGSAFW